VDQLEGKTAVITGGSSGIGLATAQRFLEEGAEHVYITGRRQAELDAAVKSLGDRATGVRGNVGDLADLDTLYERIASDGRRLDVVFANAGGGYLDTVLSDISEELFDEIIGIHLKGVLFTAQKALPLLNDGGSIVLTGSIFSVEGTVGYGIYAAAKAGVRSFARTWANELRSRRIRVNTMSPGTINTPPLAQLETEEYASFREVLVSRIPAGRMGTSEEAANAVLFLAGQQGSFVNGVELFVDGGTVQI
jgi:NAD(P)-dependent dehydrogenase (short-subunit alcohol dehydrogenase family)